MLNRLRRLFGRGYVESKIYVRFRHRKCGSLDVVPVDWGTWPEPCFECLGCGCLTDGDIEAVLTRKAPEDGFAWEV